MGSFAAGEVVMLSFPFSDLSRHKLRPAVVLATAGPVDNVVCQITSNPYNDLRSLRLDQASFATGGLDHISYARPAKLFTAHDSLIFSSRGYLRPDILEEIRQAVISVVQES